MRGRSCICRRESDCSQNVHRMNTKQNYNPDRVDGKKATKER